MTSIFSVRAQAYLRSLERRDHVSDLRIVRDALARSHVPPLDAFLELHDALAGYVEPAGNDEFVYGVIHPNSYWYGALAPEASQEEGTWFATYADAHPSYERRMDEHGVLYQEGGAPRASSFRILIEQHALVWEFCSAGPFQVDTLNAQASLAHFEPFRVEPLSDRFSTILLSDDFCALTLGPQTLRTWARPGAKNAFGWGSRT